MNLLESESTMSNHKEIIEQIQNCDNAITSITTLCSLIEQLDIAVNFDVKNLLQIATKKIQIKFRKYTIPPKQSSFE